MKKIKTYYEVLDLPEEASAKEIKQAFRSHVKEWHPDLHPEKADAAEKTQELNEAYSVLSDPDKRLKYDEYLSYIRMDHNPFQKEPVKPTTEETEPSPEEDMDYSNDMSFKDYVENVANESYKTYQDAFNGEVHKFDEEGYRKYVKSKGTVFDKQVDKPGMILIPFGIMMFGYIIFNNLALFTKASSFSLPVLPLVLLVVGSIAAVIIILDRKNAAEEARAKKMSGIDSLAEADKWFDVWLYPEKPLSECRKAFFTFSVGADKHILSRFSKMSPEEQEKYADIIELLKECINYREKQ